MGYSFRSPYSMCRFSYEILNDADNAEYFEVHIKALELYENKDHVRFLKNALVRVERYKQGAIFPEVTRIISEAGNYAYYNAISEELVIRDPYAPGSRFCSENWFKLLSDCVQVEG